MLYHASINKDFQGEIELDESYFGGKGKGLRGRGTAKTPMFGLLKRNGYVYAQVIQNATKSQLRSIVKEFVKTGTLYIQTNGELTTGLYLTEINTIELIIGEMSIPTGKESI